MRIERKFKQLTRYTYPYGTEKGLLSYLPKGYKEDGLGNYFLQIGDKPSTMFTCHLDTACGERKKVTHVKKGDIIGTDGTTILGADDKAGMVVLLYMIENKVPGLYYFFEGEEVGCVGSKALASVWEQSEFSEYIKKVISFDRRGLDSVITEQGWGICCSDEFAKDLSYKLNMTNPTFYFSPDPTGIFTDSAEFMDLVPECTNISVGYYNEHTKIETQNIDFLRKLCESVCEIDWESLPVVRDHTSDWEYDYSFFDEKPEKNKLTWSSNIYSFFEDRNGETMKLYISEQHVEEEKKEIFNWLTTSGGYYNIKEIKWDGNELKVDIDGTLEYVGSRKDLIHLIPDLSDVPIDHISETYDL